MLANLSLEGLARYLRREPIPALASSRRNAVRGRLLISTLLYLVVMGLVAIATTGVFFGVGFSLLASPSTNTIAGGSPYDLTRSDAGAQRADHEDAAASQATAMSPAAAIVARPPLAQPPALDGSAQLVSAAPDTEPSTPTAPMLEPAPARAVSLASPIQSGAAPLTTDSAQSFGGKADDASQGRRALDPKSGVRSSSGNDRYVRPHRTFNSAGHTTPREQQRIPSEASNRAHHGARKTGALSTSSKHG
jgi:hypothetical protein